MASDFISDIDSQGNKVLVEYIGYDYDVVIPNDITIIGEWAFYDCYFIESIAIPDSVTTIEMAAFYECSSMESITIPTSVTQIEAGAFYGCDSLEEIKVASGNPRYSSIDGVLFDKRENSLLIFPMGKDQAAYSIPWGVTSIEMAAFALCSSLESVYIPNSVTSIGEGAFLSVPL
jgi:deoxycytidine triphosphate deaminase